MSLHLLVRSVNNFFFILRVFFDWSYYSANIAINPENVLNKYVFNIFFQEIFIPSNSRAYTLLRCFSSDCTKISLKIFAEKFACIK
nr:MAG TPA: hypothetical protein [Caudoviricetes sp.]